MSETKTFIMPDGDSGLASAISNLAQSRGIDPNLLLAMNGGGFGGNNGGWWVWILFLLLLGGNGNWGGWGNGNHGNLANMINNDNGRELLMSAIQGNGSAIGSLAQTLNCDINTISGAIQSLQAQMQNCCCDNKMAVLNQTNQLQSQICNLGNSVERGFGDMKYETAAQTCEINKNILAQTQSLKDNANANNQAILAKLGEMQTNALQDKLSAAQSEIATLKAGINNSAQTSMVAQMLAPLQADLNAIKAAQPNTISVQYPNVTAVPTAQLYGYGYGFNPLNGGWA